MEKIFILSLINVVIYLCIKTKKSLQMLQQNWYNLDQRYLKWILKNPNKVFINPDMLFILFIAGLFINAEITMIFFAVFYLLLAYYTYRQEEKIKAKLPLKITSRVRRLAVTTLILYLIPILTMALTFDVYNLTYYYVVIGLLTYLNCFVVMVANFINIPVEAAVMKHYKNMAINKLRNMTNLKVIGITGSYGKTSSKNILNDVLNVKYNALATPKNFNTPSGLMITINNYLDKFNDLFIAEMGAFKKGEIKELCDFVRPTYGILTKVGEAHLESFGSRENIQSGKFELIESLPTDGIAVLNKDDEWQVSYKLKNKCQVIWIGIDNKAADVRATNIKLSPSGTTFDCMFKNDNNKYSFETKLLGKANIYNILASIALGHALGISIEQLQLGVKKVRPVEHRLELRQYYDINLIDDSYNSNPTGAKMALDVLNLMPGKKMVITPGMIELGSQQYEANLELGKQIADVCDEVILVGKDQTKPIYEGLMVKKFAEDKIHILNDVMQGFPLIRKLKEGDTYVLLENDLPDLFNE
ncbi:MAG: UDP-N-acetylmuramoyl-tripeptide--D-alanyl-D-alanine ligase [Bacilli bacterium]